MKLTALISDKLIEEVRKRAKRRTTTECVVVALEEWVEAQKLAELTRVLDENPLSFRRGFSAATVRRQNRRGRT